MDVRNWTVCLIEPSRFEAKLMIDLLRNAGVDNIKLCANSEGALDLLEMFPANIIIGAVEMTPIEGAAWTKTFRRNTRMANRKAAVFLTSRAFSRAMAEDCRHAGVNALIGKPVSTKILLATINKVLSAPRAFIDAPGYVGPCRRAGIVTAGTGAGSAAPVRRRKADEAAKAAEEAAILAQAFATLTSALTQMAQGLGGAAQCNEALARVQAFAVNANDKPLATVCTTLAQQLTAHDLRSDTGKAALQICAKGIAQLAELGMTQTAQREQVAAGVLQTIAQVAKAA